MRASRTPERDRRGLDYSACRFGSMSAGDVARMNTAPPGSTPADAGRSARGPDPDEPPRASVAIIAPTRLCRDGLATALGDGRRVVATSDRRDDLLGLAGLRDAVIVVDAATRLLTTLPLLRSILVDCAIVVFGLGTDEDVLTCAQHDVAGYLDRAAGIDELIGAIARVADGELVCPERHVGPHPTGRRRPDSRTPTAPANPEGTGDHRAARRGTQQQGNRRAVADRGGDRQEPCPQRARQA